MYDNNTATADDQVDALRSLFIYQYLYINTYSYIVNFVLWLSVKKFFIGIKRK